MASLPDGSRSQHAAVRWRETVLVSGGLDQDTVLSSVVRYSPDTDTWTHVTQLPVTRADHSMVRTLALALTFSIALRFLHSEICY